MLLDLISYCMTDKVLISSVLELSTGDYLVSWLKASVGAKEILIVDKEGLWNIRDACFQTSFAESWQRWPGIRGYGHDL